MKLFVSQNCSDCIRAKRLLDVLDIEYQIFDTETTDGLAEFHLLISNKSGNLKIPALVYSEVVGYDILKEYLLQGIEVLSYLDKRLKRRKQ